MKKLLSLALLISMMPAASAANGDPSTLQFITGSGGTGPFILDVDGTTKVGFGGGMAQIYAGPDAANLAPVGTAAAIGVSGTSFFDGIVAAGTTASVSTVPGVNDIGGVGAYQIRAWSGTFASYDLAVAGNANVGASAVVDNFTFGTPGTPGNQVTGFTTFSLVAVPEPGTITLGLLGLGGLIASRRRKNA